MNIYDLVRKGVNEITRQQPHVTGEADELNISLFQLGDDPGVVFLTRTPVSFNHYGFDITRARFLKSRSDRFVADNNCNLGVRYLTAFDCVNKRDHVRSPAGNENTDLHLIRTSCDPETTR